MGKDLSWASGVGASLCPCAAAETRCTRCTSASLCSPCRLPAGRPDPKPFLVNTPGYFKLSGPSRKTQLEQSEKGLGRPGGVFPKSTRYQGHPRTQSNCRSRGSGGWGGWVLGTPCPNPWAWGCHQHPAAAGNPRSVGGPGTDAGCCCQGASTSPVCWRSWGGGGMGEVVQVTQSMSMSGLSSSRVLVSCCRQRHLS